MKSTKSVSSLIAALALLAFGTPAHAGKMDRSIESSARQSYVFKTYLKSDDIRIQSKNGIVILTGTVSENFHKILAQETLADIPGVTSIDNRLETIGTVPIAHSDSWLRDKIKLTLSFHRSVAGASTVIDVREGVVTLQGVATSIEQKELTTEYTKDVDGVEEVKNLMTVANPDKGHRSIGQKVDDSSITAQVKMTLLYHRSTSAIHTTVKTRRGIVTLTGTAKNSGEKIIATRLALDVTGVKDVLNQMILE